MNVYKHVNPNKKRAAKAPYNFVPLADEIVQEMERPDRDIYHSDRFTGMLHCMLETQTPLYTRAANEAQEPVTKDKKQKAKADFFYIDPTTKQPVIPGSSLRGMLRTLIEIITYSKPQPVTDRQLFFRTLDDSAIGKAYGKRMVTGDRNADGAFPNVHAGYMEKVGHDYFIRPGKSIKGTQFYRVEEELARAVVINGIGNGTLKNMSFQNERPSPRNTAKKETYWKPNNSYAWGRTQVWFKPVAPTSHKPRSAQFYAAVTELRLLKEGESRPGGEWEKGWFIASGWVPGARSSRGKRMHWVIAPPEGEERRIAVNEIDIDAYEELGAGRSQTIEKQKMSVLPKNQGELVPCFYAWWQDKEGNKRIAFGHTAMFRLPYEYSPRDLLPYSKEQLQKTDFAESIFGWVDDKKGRTIAGRVSVCDARVTQVANRLHLLEPSEPPLTPLLSSPKPTSFQHYLTQGSDEKKELYHYQDKSDTTLRGYKLYWHKDDNLRREDYHDANATSDSTQHTVMRPVDKGVTFAFDIHFENLSTEELGALLWILQIAGDDKHCLKIGMAKPLGLGSVTLQTQLVLSGRLPRYRNLFVSSDWKEKALAFDSVKPTDLPESSQVALLKEVLKTQETVEVGDWSPFINQFEQYILAQLGIDASPGSRSFLKLSRVQTLLTLLQWPGERRLDNGYNQTRYMSLEEFKQRPVLPDPLWLTRPEMQMEQNNQQNIRKEASTMFDPGQNRAGGSSISVEWILDMLKDKSAQGEIVVKETQSISIPQQTSLDELKEKDALVGKVVVVEQNSVVVDIGSGIARHHIDQVWPPVKDQATLEHQFPADRVISIWVKGRNKHGKVQLTMYAPTA